MTHNAEIDAPRPSMTTLVFGRDYGARCRCGELSRAGSDKGECIDCYREGRW